MIKHVEIITALMMDFDSVYYHKLHEFFNNNSGATFSINDLSTEPEKFICHTLLYQHRRKPEEVEVKISFDEQHIMIIEFFQNVLNAKIVEKLNAQFTEPVLQPVQPRKNPFA